MTSELPPLVLLHGFAMSGNAWRETIPLLQSHHQIYAPSALGHRGGPEPQRRPVSAWDVIDAAERYLDESGLERPHLAGNSMGGFMAIELARRGRAASVCALSPGGFWSGDLRAKTMNKVRQRVNLGRKTRFITAQLMRFPNVRRRALREATGRGDLLSYARAVEITEESLECTIIDDIVDGDENVAPMDPLPCPITIAWGERDVVIPVELYEVTVRERLPSATFKVLANVGHVPMLDDPELVASTILSVTGTAKA